MRAYGWLVAVVVTAVVAAIAAVAMMPPDGQVIDPVPARAADYFTPQQIERGQDYRRPNFYISLAALAAEFALLVWLVRRPPRWLQTEPKWWKGALAGAAIAASLSVVTLPFTIVLRIRARDVGLNTRSWPGWAWDWVLSVAINAVLMGLVAMALLWLMRKLPRAWWVGGAVVAIVGGTLWVVVSPIVLDPLFNRFVTLRQEPLRGEVLQLARDAGVRVSQIQVMDASRRTTGANAYVAGLGASKRIVIYDNLLRDFNHDEQLNIIAHELGHEHYSDVRNGLIYVAIVAPFGMFALALAVRRFGRGQPGSPAMLPALALFLVLLSTGITYISNSLSRAVEARADSFALRETNAPDALIALQRRLVIRNVSDPEPPGWVTAVFGTHPPPLDRIGMALAYRERAASRASTSWGLLR